MSTSYLMTKITYTPEFKKEFKRLSKKFVSLNQDMKDLVAELEKNPILGKSIGKNIFKIRLGIKSKGKGKRGGAKVITYLYSLNDELYLLYLYDKSEQETISTKEIESIINSIIE